MVGEFIRELTKRNGSAECIQLLGYTCQTCLRPSKRRNARVGRNAVQGLSGMLRRFLTRWSSDCVKRFHKFWQSRWAKLGPKPLYNSAFRYLKNKKKKEPDCSDSYRTFRRFRLAVDLGGLVRNQCMEPPGAF